MLLLRTDGYTESATVKGPDGDELHVMYRPALAEEVEEVEASLFDSDGKLDRKRWFRDEMIPFLAEHLVSWSGVVDESGEAELTVANVRRLPWLVLNRLYGIVTKTRPQEATDSKN